MSVFLDVDLDGDGKFDIHSFKERIILAHDLIKEGDYFETTLVFTFSPSFSTTLHGVLVIVAGEIRASQFMVRNP